jgi:exopolyphosphatase/guanosine-5'-triphosphate,3'-diphosphate pyrophosphatase
MAAMLRRRRRNEPVLAVVDLGSNSFRLVLASVAQGHIAPLDTIREGVRLAAALGPDGRLGNAGQARALECLERFGERIRDLPSDSVRAVGTNTLRRARDVGGFLERARRALGHPVEVISGREEARLIYQGVALDLGPAEERRLVVDIGGGSTECILGRGASPERLESLYMGCVGMTLAHFGDGRIDRERLRRAELQARVELESIAGELAEADWQTCAGASGTIRAVEAIARRNGWSSDGIDLDSLKRLRRELLAAGEVRALRIPGLTRERAAVMPGGLAILLAIFRAFGVRNMIASRGSLREGLLQDLAGRLGSGDVRPRTVARLQEQYRVDREQAGRVERTALALLSQVQEAWELPPRLAHEYLAWAARVHEIGRLVAHGGYHKHGAYLLANSELPGFSLQEQNLLAALVRAHRRKVPAGLFDDVAAEQREPAARLMLILRLAVLLERSRRNDAQPPVRLRAEDGHLEIRFPRGWLRTHPLTRADLEQERAWLEAAGWELSWL